ncbi:MAG TPA: PLP-dependent aminotransferase family protein [Miltoncostaeaceae bacterium]|nr:PLP-dependent aminotransferase family protein [Miltoncostaeaceae bacterium]
MPTTISFARGAPCPEALATGLIADCARAALEDDGVRVLSYGTGNGYPPLREVLAAEHGVAPDQVLVTNGSLQGFVFLLEALLQPGDLVAVEAPTYDRALLQLRLHGMEILPVPVEDDGMDVRGLRAACEAGRAPRLLYTIPNFQNPSGATLSAAKRAALVELCDEHDIVILEDDPYGKLRFEGEPLHGLAELAAPGRVLFTSSFSKTVAPGLRVGYMIAPPELAGRLAAAASRTYISPSLLAEAAVHRLVTGGHLPGNIERVTGLMRERRDAMMAGMRHMPEGTRCVPPAGGFFCWLTLPEGMSADALFADAEAAGVPYVRGSDCVVEGGERTLRLAYSGVSPAEIDEGMTRLGAVFRAAAAAAAAA